MAPELFGLYVSAVDGQPVTRFGTRTLIGAMRRITEPTVIDYQPAIIVAITVAEYRKYRREYERAIGNGSLVRRTADEWLEQTYPMHTIDVCPVIPPLE